MARNEFTVNSQATLDAFIEKVRGLYGSGTYLVFTWRGARRAKMSQKALFHIWLRTYAGHLGRKPIADVTASNIEALKRAVKVNFYNETHYPWMIETVADPFHPDKEKKDVVSFADLDPWQAYELMTWMQSRAAETGCILEVEGEFSEFKDSGEYGTVGEDGR